MAIPEREPTENQPLTPKQEAFCLAYLATGNASEAYREAYEAGGMKAATVHRSATELLDNPKVTARLAQLRAPAVAAAQLTLESHLRSLEKLRDSAEADGNFSAAVSAEVARGKASGLYREKVEHSGPGGETLEILVRKFVGTEEE